MTIKYAPAFFKKLKKLDIRIRKSLKERILLFSENPHDPQLNNHPLAREYQGYRSIDIKADWRALYQEKQEGDEEIAYFAFIGTYKELYGQSST